MRAGSIISLDDGPARLPIIASAAGQAEPIRPTYDLRRNVTSLRLLRRPLVFTDEAAGYEVTVALTVI